ncbi:ankyrin repeat domain-containing protein SOWAHC-like [Astyanax mexicanus]|uniref:Ankyrin repeat domain-containing protein SOWAHC-like n=1 Tax=Astyanax mexicanus TaxID=7994 RepID=A0A8T2M7E7_ASTMX|nr:ankyrin repeat domain-containing protein SOWAHC-like [Astyanax mexicanus]
MASECTQEAVLRFLKERGGRARNVDLIEHFRSAIPTEPGKKSAAKEAFKGYVDSVAVVKVDNGEKYVCLKKKFRGGLVGGDRDGRQQDGTERTGDTEQGNGGRNSVVTHATRAVPSESSENGDAKQEIAPGTGCGTAGPGVPGNTSPAGEDQPEAEMGNQVMTRKGSEKGVRKLEDIPEITVLADVSLLHVTDRTEVESMVGSEERCDQTVPDGLESSSPDQTVPDGLKTRTHWKGTSLEGTSSTQDDQQTDGQDASSDQTAPTGPLDLQSESDQKISQWLRRKQSGGSQRGGEQSADEGPFIDINTPKGSRKNFLEHMMSSSPQVRRSMALRSSVYLSNRCKDSARSDGGATSLNSSSGNNMYYENASVALEPLEHEWMMCASDGEWESLQRLLATEPGLVGKKDFVTGFTCLHWAAKLGKAELLALLVSFATQRGVPVDVNARSSAGYTPLHLAAMHNHMEVVKLLVGAYDADVEVRDYSGRKASQYMKSEVAHDVLDIVGAISEADAEVQRTDGGEASGWRLSRVLQANLRPLKLLNHSASEDDVSTVGENAGLVKEKVLRRKTSLRGLRPRLSKIRTRTQIVHSTSLSGHFEREAVETSGSFRSRPKSNLFG